MTVLSDISAAPTAGESTMPQGIGNAGGQRNGEGVVAGRPQQVLDHLAVGRAGQADDREHVARVAAHQHDVGRLDGHIRPGADGDAEVGFDQRGGIVDAVADHGDRQSACFISPDLRRLLLRQDLGEELVEAELAGHRLRPPPGIAGQHHQRIPIAFSRGDGLERFLADEIGQGDGADRRVLAAAR